MSFRITGLSPEPFRPLFGLPEDELQARGIRRFAATGETGFPDRIEMREARAGETVLLLNHMSQPAHSPYRATHAIYVREGATERYDRVGEVPGIMRSRLLSLRAFDAEGMMVDGDVVDGREVEAVIARMLSDPRTDYIHAHNAKRGCYAGRIDRA
jgi:hypothetical protein